MKISTISPVTYRKGKLMKILFYCWSAYTEQKVRECLERMGHSLVICHTPCKNYTRDMQLAAELIQLIHKEKVDCVFTVNYYPIISSVCHTVGILYYSWVFDSPHYTLFALQSRLDCNRIFVFDRELQERLQQLGVKQVYHLPLASDAEGFGRGIARADRDQRYAETVSFLGTLYTDQYDYYDTLLADGTENSQLMEELQRVVKQHCFHYGEAISKLYADMAAAEAERGLLTDILSRMGLGLGEDYMAEAIDIALPAVIEKKVTVEERKRLVTELCLENCGFALYTQSDVSAYPDIVQRSNRGPLDYFTQMPLLFHRSKVNLNITLRSIHSGIPLRVMDVLACGGFALSNYQPEIEEFFAIGEEIEVFRSLEECKEKIQYYLGHEEQRERIARAGYEKVSREFSYERQLGKILGVK